MEFSIVENLSRTQESIFNLFRCSHLNYCKKTKKTLLFYMQFPNFLRLFQTFEPCLRGCEGSRGCRPRSCAPQDPPERLARTYSLTGRPVPYYATRPLASLRARHRSAPYGALRHGLRLRRRGGAGALSGGRGGDLEPSGPRWNTQNQFCFLDNAREVQ